MTAIEQRGVPGSVGVCPEIYREKAFVDAGFVPPARLPVARELGETPLMLPVHPIRTTAIHLSRWAILRVSADWVLVVRRPHSPGISATWTGAPR